jgi:hypothetical protein
MKSKENGEILWKLLLKFPRRMKCSLTIPVGEGVFGLILNENK